ncbi:MAG TPA: hypothetical protein VK983_01155 [Candidatus Limnocylindrales bacterium]|nr:hypothetical protein [Candidatus Limnocylindrales bacterium]
MSIFTRKERTKKQRIMRRLVGTLLVLSGLGVGVYSVLQMISGPAEGTVITSIPVSQNEKPPVELEQYDGKYLTFARPVTYRPQSMKQQSAASLESQTFVATGMASKVLVVTVSTLPGQRLEDDASYSMRKLHPEKYKLQELKVKGERVVLASSQAEFQEVAFWPHQGRLLIFALSGMAAEREAVMAEYMQMLESVAWL